MRMNHSGLRTATLILVAALGTACGADSPTAEGGSAAGLSADSAARGAVPSASVATAATRNFRCDGTAGGRIYSYYTVTGQLTGTGQPVNVLSYPTYYPANPGSYRKTGTLVKAYPIAPGFTNWRAWNVTGHANGVGTPGDLYYLILPRVLPGPGGTTPGELHIQFNGGQYGWWQVISSCVIS